MFEQVRVRRTVSGDGSDLLLLGDGSIKQPLLQEKAGTAQVVYIDPPFMTGEVFTRRRRFGTQGWRSGSPCPVFPGYDDRHESRESYIAMLRGLLENGKMLLKEDGMLLLHLDWHASHWGRVLCDEIFGEDLFVNEIIWAYESGGRSKKHFSRKHDTILMFARSRQYRFHLDRVPISRTENRTNHLKRNVDENGRAYRSVKVAGKEYRYYDDDPVYPGDVWTDISHIQQRSPQRTGYGTQKPLALLERLLKPLVDPGDLVVDLCCGSGTALVMAKMLGCRLLGVDMSPEALLITRARLKDRQLDLQLESSMDPVPLEGECDPIGGVVTLAGFPATNPAFPAIKTALDPLECWSVGELTGDTLQELDIYQRSTLAPEITPMCILGQNLRNPAVSTVDAAGVYRVYRWVD